MEKDKLVNTIYNMILNNILSKIETDIEELDIYCDKSVEYLPLTYYLNDLYINYTIYNPVNKLYKKWYYNNLTKLSIHLHLLSRDELERMYFTWI